MKHDREAFDCGEEALTEFLRRYARKSHDLGGAKTFLAIDDADNKTIHRSPRLMTLGCNGVPRNWRPCSSTRTGTLAFASAYWTVCFGRGPMSWNMKWSERSRRQEFSIRKP